MKPGVGFLKLNTIIKIQGKAIYSTKFMRDSFWGVEEFTKLDNLQCIWLSTFLSVMRTL